MSRFADFLLLRPVFGLRGLRLIWFGYLLVVAVEILVYVRALSLSFPAVMNAETLAGTAAWLVSILVRLLLVRVILEVAARLLVPPPSSAS
jgi:hypothetical protein